MARWYRVKPLLGVKERKLPLLGLGFVLEYHRTEDWLEIYYLSEAGRVSFNRVAAVEEKAPPDLPPVGYEVRVKGKQWWLPVEVRDWHGLLETMNPGSVVQVVGLRDHKLREKLLRKAEALREGREYTAGRVLASVLLGDAAFTVKRDEQLAQELRRRAQSVYQLALRVYSVSEEEARELAEQLLARLIVDDEDHWRLERIKIKKSKDMARLRDPLQLKKGDTSRPWLPEDKLRAILELPEPTSTIPVDFARGAPLPSIVPKRSEIRVGELSDGREIRIDVDDLYRHAWVIGRTGAGKSTFIVNMVLRLWGTGRGAVVVIDPHGDLARDIVEAAPTLEGVVFLDPDAKPFGLNPIELPRLPNRDLAKSVAIDNVVAVLEKAFRLPETAVNVKFILRTLLGVLYEKTPSPSLADLYEAIIALYNGELELETDDPMWRAQVELLREMQEQSFISALNRLQPFAANPLLRRVSSKTTVDLGGLIEKRGLVVFSIPKAYGETVSELLASTILLKLWFYVLERALLRKPRTPVFVFIDEFQNVGGLPVIETILSEARKYGLHLIAAHQHTKQLPEELLQSLLTNTALKVVFAVEGADVQRLRMVDPDFAKEIERVLPSLTVGTALLRIQARPGEEPYPPLLIRTDPPPPKRRGLEEALPLLPSFEPPSVESSDVKTMLNPVLAYLPRERLDPIEQLILYHVYVLGRGKGGEWIQWSDVNVRLGLPRKKADEARDRLAARGLIEAVKQGNRWLLRYRRGLFAGLRQVAPRDEGWRLAVTAVLYYLEHGYAVYPARQDPGLSARPDLVAIPFDKASLSLRYSQAVAVEIESCNEINTHPEQVVRNIEKHGSTPFAEVHVWLPKRCLAEAQRPLTQARKPKPVKLFPVTFTGRKAVLLEAALEEIRGGEQPSAGLEAASDAGAEEEVPGGRVEASAGGEERPWEGLRGLLEAQAEKLDKILEALNQMNKLLEQLAQNIEPRGEPEPLREPARETKQQTQQLSQPETHETEQREPQNCLPVELDEPPGQTACLPPQVARLANQYRNQGYRLTQTPTGRIYATRRNRRIPLY